MVIYSGSNVTADELTYGALSAGGVMGRLVIPTAPPRVNLASLLVRNVPSISANLRRLQEQINTDEINKLLAASEQHNEYFMKTVKRDRQSFNDSWNNPANDTQSANTNVTFVPPDCSAVPDKLVGKLFDGNHSHSDNYTEAGVLAQNPDTLLGGQWKPHDCVARHQVAVVIPYRDRMQHLTVLLAHLHPILQRQQLSYKIYVVEQYGNLTFNKARIMNIAFITALRDNPQWHCFVFHDVDLVPEDDRNLYSCPQQPRHMSVAIDQMNYELPYEELVGGVLAIRTEHFFSVNGYSNLYWGWGAEDDDLAYRIQHVGLRIIRPPISIARYRMIQHKKRTAVDGRIRYRLLWTGVRRYKIDGINSLQALKWRVMWVEKRPLFTHIMVDIGPPPPGF